MGKSVSKLVCTITPVVPTPRSILVIQWALDYFVVPDMFSRPDIIGLFRDVTSFKYVFHVHGDAEFLAGKPSSCTFIAAVLVKT